MFNPSQADVRNFFFAILEKVSQNEPLSDLEKIAYSVILEHPEFQAVLTNRKKYFEYRWTVEMGETNPFLHLSLHVSIIEQLSIDQPPGIKNLYNQLCTKFGNQHTASHQLMDCLGEMIWQAQRNNTPPDMQVYFNCINKKLGQE